MIEAPANIVLGDAFALFRKQIAMLESILAEFPASPRKGIMEDGLFCLKLFMTLYTEANKAVQAGAWFAAAAVSGAALEAMLMSRCLMSAEKVIGLPKWRSLHKVHKGDFRVFVRSMDLGKMIEVGEYLSWFPNGDRLPRGFLQAFSPYTDRSVIEGIQRLFEGTQNIGQMCAAQVRCHRNLLHPAVCLKEGEEPSVDAGMVATLMFMIACTALQETITI